MMHDVNKSGLFKQQMEYEDLTGFCLGFLYLGRKYIK